MIFLNLRSKFPTTDVSLISALSEIWDIELDRIILRMLDISSESCATIPLEAKHEAVFEMAKLASYIAELIIEKKLAGSNLEEINPDLERAWLDTQECADRIENTATLFAQNVWIKFLNDWWKKHPIASSSKPSPAHSKFAKISHEGVRRQHFSPKFSNRYWADGGNDIRIYSRALHGSVSSVVRPMGIWAREDFIYSQSLEALLSEIESDAGTPYKKLLNMVPFGEEDRRHWVAFLTSQLLRTPWFILRHLRDLRSIIERNGIAYSTHTASLRRAHATLFTNNKVFDTFYRMICEREWTILSSRSNEGAFIRGDVPVVIGGSIKRKTWQLIYPMTPSKCFVAGPEICEIPDVPIPRSTELNATQVRALNRIVVAHCRRNAMGVVWQDDSVHIETAFGKQSDRLTDPRAPREEYWGRPR